VYQTCQSWLSSVLSDLAEQPFTNVELVLRLVYLLGEVLTDKVMNLNHYNVQWLKLVVYSVAIRGSQCSRYAMAPTYKHCK